MKAQIPPKQTITTIDISKENIKFSAAHFTIFSATARERLHGHNFKVRAHITAVIDENGMCFNYQEIKSRLRKLCSTLDEYTLLPSQSPYVSIEESGDYYQLTFNGETMSFLRSDTLLLPIRNTTVEELSRYLLQRLITSDNFVNESNVDKLTLNVSSGDGQSGGSTWERSGQNTSE